MDPDPDPCEPIRAMIAGYQLGRRVSGPRIGSRTERQSGQGQEPVRCFFSPPKILATFFSLPLFTFLLPCVDERTSSKIGLYQGEKSENPCCVVRISKRNLRGLIRKQEGKDRHGAHDGEDAAHA